MGRIIGGKKKGRPSNADLRRRNASAEPERRRRSCRQRSVRYNFDIDDYVDDEEFYEEHVGRREKKLRVLLGEDDSESNQCEESSSSDEYDVDDEDEVKPSKKRKINGGESADGEFDGEDDEDDEIGEIRGGRAESEEDAEAGGANSISGTPSGSPNGVFLPDRRTLELILDELQKKDTYGVYAEPVDPEELPDYHTVIKHPMDFSTVRKKLAKGTYLTLEQFESDVTLICTNAMQYNAPDTIYYKQASSILDLAKRKFQRLRLNVDHSGTELKSGQKFKPNSSPPKKQSQKSMVRTVQEPAGSDLSGATLATTGEFQNGSSVQATSFRPSSFDGDIAENDSLLDDKLDKGDDLTPDTGKGFASKLGRKPPVQDENRRATFNLSMQPVPESESILSTFEGESKQLIPVGLHSDYSYTRSLARFAATLGSVPWKIASQRIEQALPESIKFGRGWVGEYEPLTTPVLMIGNCTLKESEFLSKYLGIADVRTSDKASKNQVPEFQKPPTRFASKQESFKGAGSEMAPPSVPFLRPKLCEIASLNHLQQNPNPRDLIKAKKKVADVESRQISNASDIQSPKAAVVTRNENGSSLLAFKQQNGDPDGFIFRGPSNRNPTLVGPDCNTKVQNQQVYLNGSPFGPRRYDLNDVASNGSGNVGSTAGGQWMSLGGVSVTRPTQNRISLSQQTPLASYHQQPPFHGEFTRFHQQPVHAFLPQPVRVTNEPQFQNRQVGFPQLATADLSRFQVQSHWSAVTPQPRPKQQESRPPDLNIGYQSAQSPVRQSSGMVVDSQQHPDLALQL